MTRGIRISFERRMVTLPLTSILPLRQLAPNVAASVKYARIVASIETVGLAEPLVVAAQKDGETYLLLDGHLRYFALRDRGEETVRCLLSDDDEAFTYNKRVNRLATVQEHYMIERAVQRGASEEKIARALGIDVKSVRRRRTLLDSISAEVVELLKDRTINPLTFEVLRKMKAPRQFEAAELMVSANNFTHSYAKALLASTKQMDLAKPERGKRVQGLTPEQMARMEREMENLTRDMKAVEDAFGDDVLQLVVASRYLGKLIGNERVASYLDARHPEILAEFKTIVRTASLEQAA